MANGSDFFNKGTLIQREPAQPGINNLRTLFDPVRRTPPALPQAQSVDVSDLLAKIEALMAPTPAPAAQPMNAGNILQQLFTALPQALAVGISRNPSETLEKQLERQQAMQFQRELEESRRKERLDEIRRMTGIDIVKGEISERRAVAREGREREFKLFETEEEQAFELRKQQLDFEARRRMQEEQNDFLRSLEDVRYQRESIAQSIKRTTELSLMGIPPENALSIAKTELAGLPITGADKKLLDAAYLEEFGFQKKAKELGLQKELATIERLKAEAFQARAQGRASLAAANAKQAAINDTLKEIRQGNFVVDADGNLVHKSLTDNMFGTTINGKAVKFTDPRQVEAIFQQKYVIPSIQSDSNQNLKPTAVQGAGQAIDAASADQWVRTNIAQGADSKDLMNDAMKEPDEAVKKAKEGAIIRATKEGVFNKQGKDTRPTIEQIRKQIQQRGPAQGLPYGMSAKDIFGPTPTGTPTSTPTPFPRQRVPLSDQPGTFAPRPTPTPDEGPKPLGILPPFHPEVIRRTIDRFDIPLKVPDKYANINPGAGARAIEQFVEGAGQAGRNVRSEIDRIQKEKVDATGNIGLDLLLQRMGLLKEDAVPGVKKKSK